MFEKTIVSDRSRKINPITGILLIITLGMLVLFLMMLSSGDSGTSKWFGFFAVSVIITLLAIGFTGTAEITVTDKRVYGQIAFGKRVDLPLDSISAVVVTSVFTSGVSVSTPSGNITFCYLTNKETVALSIRKLLIERQSNKSSSHEIHMEPSHADELKKFKELLDGGVITAEEFEAKKKEILKL